MKFLRFCRARPLHYPEISCVLSISQFVDVFYGRFKVMSKDLVSKNKVQPRKLKGFRDFSGPLFATKKQITQIIQAEAALSGFQSISTPVLEYADTLLGAGSEETDKQVYRFEDHGGRSVALRFDLTVPFARYVAENQGTLVFPFKKLQIGDVWRGENTQKGRYREFTQCDFDIIGLDSFEADFEVIATILRSLHKIKFGSFTIRLGHRGILTEFVRSNAPASSLETQAKVLVLLDKMDKVGLAESVKSIAELDGFTLEIGQKICSALEATNENGRASIESLLLGSEIGRQYVTRMRQLYESLTKVSDSLGPLVKVKVDYSIARGLGYYTGVVFETSFDDIKGFGSISSGGRYNYLTERFIDRHLPGVGGSIGLDRLLAAMEDVGRLHKEPAVTAYVVVATPDAVGYSLNIVQTLREGGISSDLSLSPGKIGNQIKHAVRIGASFAIILGSNEVASKKITIKHLDSQEERRDIDIDTALAWIRQK